MALGTKKAEFFPPLVDLFAQPCPTTMTAWELKAVIKYLMQLGALDMRTLQLRPFTDETHQDRKGCLNFIDPEAWSGGVAKQFEFAKEEFFTNKVSSVYVAPNLAPATLDHTLRPTLNQLTGLAHCVGFWPPTWECLMNGPLLSTFIEALLLSGARPETMAKHLNALDHLLACLVPYATSPRAEGVLEAHKLSVANLKRCVSKAGSKESKAREWLDDRPFARRIRAVLAKARLIKNSVEERSKRVSCVFSAHVFMLHAFCPSLP